MTPTRYTAWVEQQLQPDDIIITGNWKRHREVRKELVLPDAPPDRRTEKELEEAQDEYLKLKGVI